MPRCRQVTELYNFMFLLTLLLVKTQNLLSKHNYCMTVAEFSETFMSFLLSKKETNLLRKSILTDNFLYTKNHSYNTIWGKKAIKTIRRLLNIILYNDELWFGFHLNALCD